MAVVASAVSSEDGSATNLLPTIVTGNNKNLTPCDPPPLKGEAIEILLMSGKEPRWEPYVTDHHRFYFHSTTSFDDIDRPLGGECIVQCVRQGDDKKLIKTLWRVSRGRKRRKTSTFVAEQSQAIIDKETKIIRMRKRQRKQNTASPQKAFLAGQSRTVKEMKRIHKGQPKRSVSSFQKISTSVSTGNTSSASSMYEQDGSEASNYNTPLNNARAVVKRSCKSHYVEQVLGMTKARIMNSIPDAIRSKINECCWIPWRDSKLGYRHFPALVISPFDLRGGTAILKEWIEIYQKATINQGILNQLTPDWKVLVYWYSKGWSRSTNCRFQAFSLVNRETIVEFREGMKRRYDQPEVITAKKEAKQCLTSQEDTYMRGIKLMIDDYKKRKEERGGPMFFDHLKVEKIDQANKISQGRKRPKRSFSSFQKISTSVSTGNTSSVSSMYEQDGSEASNNNTPLNNAHSVVNGSCKSHYVEQALGMIKARIMNSIPDAIRNKINEYCWIPWRRYDQPEVITAKKEAKQCLTSQEDTYMHGIKLMIDDYKKQKEERGGPMFFDHLKVEKIDQANKISKGTKRKRTQKRLERTIQLKKRHSKEPKAGSYPEPFSANTLVSGIEGKVKTMPNTQDDYSPQSNEDIMLSLSYRPHYVEQELGMTKADIMNLIPDDIQNEIHDCCWIPWKDINTGSTCKHFPALILSPFDLNGKTSILEEWVKMYQQATNQGTLTSSESDWKALVYWYSKGWSRSTECRRFKAFSLVNRATIVDFKEGMRRKYNQPEDITAKKESDQCLTYQEDAYINGIELMINDHKKEKGKRGGPMFFDHLKEQELDQATKMGRKRERKRAQKRKEKAIYRVKRHGEKCRAVPSPKSLFATGVLTKGINNRDAEIMLNTQDDGGNIDPNIYSLELCAGKGRISSALREQGFKAFTLDNSPKKASDSSLSLKELEASIENGSIKGDPFLDHSFEFIWGAPDCRTWSLAASGTPYRSDKFIYGIPKSTTEKEALQAEDDIDSLIQILLEYKCRNPDLLIAIENPDSYLPKHPVSEGFKSELGLTMVRLSYCFFGDKDRPQPQKNTVLYTNSKSLIAVFGGGNFSCKGDCGTVVDNRHKVGVQDIGDRCAAYPPALCSFVARLVAADIREIRREKATRSKAAAQKQAASRSLQDI